MDKPWRQQKCPYGRWNLSLARLGLRPKLRPLRGRMGAARPWRREAVVGFSYDALPSGAASSRFAGCKNLNCVTLNLSDSSVRL